MLQVINSAIYLDMVCDQISEHIKQILRVKSALKNAGGISEWRRDLINHELNLSIDAAHELQRQLQEAKEDIDQAEIEYEKNPRIGDRFFAFDDDNNPIEISREEYEKITPEENEEEVLPPEDMENLPFPQNPTSYEEIAAAR